MKQQKLSEAVAQAEAAVEWVEGKRDAREAIAREIEALRDRRRLVPKGDERRTEIEARIERLQEDERNLRVTASERGQYSEALSFLRVLEGRGISAQEVAARRQAGGGL